MSLPRSRRETVSTPERTGPPPLRLVNPGHEPRTATVLVRSDTDQHAYLVRVEARDTVTVPLTDLEGRTTVECHLDGSDGSAVVTVDPGVSDGPILGLHESTVVVAR